MNHAYRPIHPTSNDPPKPVTITLAGGAAMLNEMIIGTTATSDVQRFLLVGRDPV